MALKPVYITIGGKDKLSQIVNSTRARLKSLGDASRRVGRTFNRYLTLPTLGAGAASLKFSMDFNKSMTNVATLIPGNIQRVQELKGNIQEMARATGKGTDDISNGLYQVISAFGDTADTSKILEANVKAAAAGMATTTDAINLTSAVTKAYGDTSADAINKVADLAFQTVKLGQTTFPELAESIGKVTPLAKELGVSQEELFGVFATGTGVTGNASEVATQYARILQAMMAPTETLSSLYAHLGVESGKQLIAQKGVAGSIKTIVDSAKKAGIPLQDLIGQVRGQVLALALAGPQWDTLNKKMDAMKVSSGAMLEAFNEVQNGINANGARFEEFKQLVITTAQVIGDKLAPVLIKLVGKLRPLFIWLANVNGETLALILGIAGIVAAIGPVITAFGFFMQGISALMPILGAFKFIWAAINFLFISSPIGWVVLGIGALIAAGILLYKNWDTIKKALVTAFNAIKNAFKSLFDWLVNTPLAKRVLGIVDKIKGVFGGGGAAGAGAGPVAGGAAIGRAIEEKNITTTNKNESLVKLELGQGFPPGTRIKTQGKAENLEIYNGPLMAGAY
jgi:TP901 family phage tail tape measure protein